jgi:hypothetical protein
VQEQARLFADGFHNLRVAMTCIRHTDSAGEVQKFFAIVGVDVSAFGTVGYKIKNATPSGSHVREVILIELISHDFP